MKLGRYKVLVVVLHTEEADKVKIFFYNNHTAAFGLTFYKLDEPYPMISLGDYIIGSLRFYQKAESPGTLTKMSGSIVIDNSLVAEAMNRINELTWHISFTQSDENNTLGERIYYSALITEYLKQNLKLYGKKEEIFKEIAQSDI